MSKIVAVRKTSDSASISAYKLDDGRVMNREEICRAVNRGEIEGCSTFETRNGSLAVRSDRGQDNYSLDELPRF